MKTKENSFSLCRVLPILFKDSANENKRELAFILSSAAYHVQKYEKNKKKGIYSILLNVLTTVQQ